jgi:uncharacterized BrkB/YihY/UPF0761 family membrane protein
MLYNSVKQSSSIDSMSISMFIYICSQVIANKEYTMWSDRRIYGWFVKFALYILSFSSLYEISTNISEPKHKSLSYKVYIYYISIDDKLLFHIGKSTA